MVLNRILFPRLKYITRQYAENANSKATNPIQPAAVNRTGDNGCSQTLSGKTLPKDHLVFEAIGATEELSSYIGLAREYGSDTGHEYVDKLKRIQTVLIDITTAISRFSAEDKFSVNHGHTKELEDWICEYYKHLPPAEQYIIPGGGQASASLHVARTICRRTERIITPLVRDGLLHKDAGIYINRLSDFLFTASRMAAKHDKRTESIYIPKPDEHVQEQ